MLGQTREFWLRRGGKARSKKDYWRGRVKAFQQGLTGDEQDVSMESADNSNSKSPPRSNIL